MTTLAHRHPQYFVNALVEHKRSPRIRIEPLTTTDVADVLKEHPAAITLAPRGAFHVDVLLSLATEKPDVFKPVRQAASRPTRWKLFIANTDRDEFNFSRRVYIVKCLKEFKLSLADEQMAPIATLIPDVPGIEHQCKALLKLISEALRPTGKASIPSLASPSNTSESDVDAEKARREALIAIRQKMLDQVGSIASEHLATRGESTSRNASQYAADQRESGKIFGVRFGKVWRYPKFQFDSKGRPLEEVKEVIAALSPDEQGWDRLQWFLEPHEALNGLTPLQVWKSNRKRVIEAAKLEHWDGRL